MIGKFITELPMNDLGPMRVSTRPKLRRFVDHDKPIHYIKEIGSGAEGAVFLVVIEGNEYAMKVVSFISGYSCPCHSYVIYLV